MSEVPLLARCTDFEEFPHSFTRLNPKNGRCGGVRCSEGWHSGAGRGSSSLKRTTDTKIGQVDVVVPKPISHCVNRSRCGSSRGSQGRHSGAWRRRFSHADGHVPVRVRVGGHDDARPWRSARDDCQHRAAHWPSDCLVCSPP
jgi:hypothetical protein